MADKKSSTNALGDQVLIKFKYTGNTVADLTNMVSFGNLAKDMSSGDRMALGMLCQEGVGIDESTRTWWIDAAKEGQELVSRLSKKEASGSVKGAAHPLLAEAVVDFSSRITSSLTSKTNIVKCSPVGTSNAQTLEKADILSRAMSYQVLVEDKDWTSGTDRLAITLAVEGTIYRKQYYDPNVGTIRSMIVSGQDIVVDDSITSLEEAPRISHRFKSPIHDIRKKVLTGYYHDVPFHSITDYDDPAKMVEIVEQMVWLPNVGRKGMQELPMLVTFLVEEELVIRVVPAFGKSTVRKVGDAALVSPIPYYTAYHFIRNPIASKWHSLGYGFLLSGVNEDVNDIIDSMLEAGKNASQISGFFDKRYGDVTGTMRLTPGEFVGVDFGAGELAQSILPTTPPAPSTALFQTLGLLLDSGRKLSSTVNLSDSPASMSPTQAAAITNQGERVYTGIFQRVVLCMGNEFDNRLTLSREYMGTQAVLYELEGEVVQDDTGVMSMGARAKMSADPSQSSETKKASLAGVLFDAMERIPGMSPSRTGARIMSYLDIENAEELMMTPEEQPVDEALELDKEKLALETKKYQLDLAKFNKDNESAKQNDRLIAARTAQTYASASLVSPNHGNQVAVRDDQFQMHLDKMELERQKLRQAGVKLQMEAIKIKNDREKDNTSGAAKTTSSPEAK